MVKLKLTVPVTRQSKWLLPQRAKLPQNLSPWLLEAGSMTQRLREHNRHFAVQWLGNHPTVLSAQELQLVDALTPDGICREVILHGDGGPVVLAWTLFAQQALQDSDLAQLGAQPIGEQVFAQKQALRDNLQIAQFDIQANPYFPAAAVWGRRSRLFLGQWPLLVHELFLPALLCDKKTQS
ncbi:MAG: chorismate--pyruvate lyase family protein [Enterovibrio sp.]